MENHRPDLPNSSDEDVSCTAPATENVSLQILFKCPTPAINATKTLTFCSLLARSTIPCACHAKRHLNVQKWRVHVVFCTFFEPQPRALFRPSQLPKVVRTRCVFAFFTCKCASRHDSVHFFDIATSKSGPNMVCFVHFDFDMCFAPQQLALFQHLNFQKCSEREVFLAFSLANVLGAATACTFSTSQLPKVSEREVFLAFSLANVLRATTACNFSSLIWPAGSAPAALARLLFDPPEPQIL